MNELFVATQNQGKMKEFRALLKGVVSVLLSPADYPGFPEIYEDGASFQENAIIKARHAAHVTGKPALADDSGLMVDALGGGPGVFSARFAGIGASDDANNSKLLSEIAHTTFEKRTAAFCCVLALCLPDDSCQTFEGKLQGLILEFSQGSGGFGYDPLFYVPEFDKTLAELPLEIKNLISHRAKALAKLKEYLINS